MTTTTWCRDRDNCCTSQRGSADRYQMRAYALAVTVALMGASVCHCGAPVDLWTGEVDRTEAGCYRPGFVVMTCEACNNDRTYVDGFDAVTFAADVLRVSLTVPVPSKADAGRMWKVGRTIGTTVRRSRYYRG